MVRFLASTLTVLFVLCTCLGAVTVSSEKPKVPSCHDTKQQSEQKEHRIMKCCPEAIPEQKSSFVFNTQADVGILDFDLPNFDPEYQFVSAETDGSPPTIITHSPVLRL